jgi:hypothetical protein
MKTEGGPAAMQENQTYRNMKPPLNRRRNGKYFAKKEVRD